MPFILGTVLNIGGGLLSGRSAQKARRAEAAEKRRLGEQNWQAGRFRPVGVTTRFGSSQFEVDPTTGAITSAGYQLSPELLAMQDRLMSGATSGLDFAERGMQTGNQLFDLGQGYLAQSPEEVAADWLSKQQALLAPGREQALSGVRQGLFNAGRGGLGISQGGDLAATNPEMAAYYNSLAQQDKALAAEAMQQGREQVRFGTGLFGQGIDIAAGGYRPYAASFGLSRELEQAGQQPLQLGMDIGRTAATINQGATQLRSNPMLSAAESQRVADSWNPWGAALTSAGSAMQNMSFPTNTFQYSGWNAPNMGMFSGARSGDVGF